MTDRFAINLYKNKMNIFENYLNKIKEILINENSNKNTFA